MLYQPLTGVGHYVYQLREALRHRAAEVAVDGFICDRLGVKLPSQETTRAGKSGSRSAKAWARALLKWPLQLALGYAARRYDIYHEPNHIPVRTRATTVTTVHDLSVIVHPDWHPADRVRWYARDFPAGVRQTTRFIAASAYTRDEMVRRLGLAASQIDVTYQAPRAAFGPLPEAEARRRVAQLALPRNFLLFVGTLEPRKNVVGLLEAFAGLPTTLRRRTPLVLAGGWGWKMESLPDSLAQHGLLDDTRLIGYQSDNVLAALYSLCTALVWPTFYEGFGLPPLEAMSCGAAVISSSSTSIPEVVGDAGVLLDPTDVPAWADAMRRVIEDEAWRNEWARRGAARAGTFSWARCADETIACYCKAVQSSR